MIALIAMKLMETGLGPKVAKLASWAIVAVLALLMIGAAVWWFNDTVDDARDAGVQTGVVTERAETQAEAIKNVEKANETRAAANDPRSCVAYNECLRSARTTTHCIRFMPSDEGCPVPARPVTGR